MRKESDLYLSVMVMPRRLRKRATRRFNPPATSRDKEQRLQLEWLPGERQEFSNVPTLPHDQIGIYCAFARYRNHLPILSQEQLAGHFSAFLRRDSSLRGISDNCCSVMVWGICLGSSILVRVRCVNVVHLLTSTMLLILRPLVH